MATLKQKYDHEEIYCTKLGHYLQFRYCRQEEQSRPCRKLKQCWSERLPVSPFLEDFYPTLNSRYFEAIPGLKLTSLIELIEKIRAGNKA